MIRNYFDRYVLGRPEAPLVAFVLALIGLLGLGLFELSEIVEGYQQLSSQRFVLDRLDRRAAHPHEAASGQPPGSPFLEGATATIAGASLLQLVTSTITRIGGTAISSEVDNRMTQPKDDTIRVVITCNLPDTALQELLYATEAGMPFLFIDTLSARNEAQEGTGGLMRVSLGVTGVWRPSKR
jgi:general secretion pathway protein M